MSSENDSPILIYTTFPSIEEAEKVGSSLVRQKLAACVNILPRMISIYEWEGQVERADEVVMLIKTKKACERQAIDETVKQHSYDIPAAVSFESSGGHAAYLEWVMAQTKS